MDTMINATGFPAFQSTPPRRRRPQKYWEENNGTRFSIHASAKEATLSRSALPSEVSFNPRLREGGDKIEWRMVGGNPVVSIHASAKEATFTRQ